MRSMLSLGLTALAASAVSAETTIAVLEFGPGGSVHRTTSSATGSHAAAVASFWNVMHRPSSKQSMQHAGMSVVPDLFQKADAGVVLGISGGDSLKAMPTANSLLEAGAKDVVGLIHVPEQAGQLMKRASKDVESIAKEDVERRLKSVAETAARGDMKGMEALSLVVDSDESAAAADEHLSRMLKTLKKQAKASGKTVVMHLVVEEQGRRRLDEQQQDGQNENANAYSNEKSMYEIQTFNLYLWTAVGLLVILFMVMSAFVAMPLMPDTLLFAETAKMGSE